MIYIPWDKKQRLKKDYHDFNKKFYYKFQKQLGKKWKVKLWTWDKINKFMEKYYNREWRTIRKYADRAVMLVDYLRWKIIYHYGGIYWQYESKLKTSIKYLVPRHPNNIVLLTELELNIIFRYWNALYKIRKLKPEERIRVATQVFAAYPKSKFIKKVVKKIVSNIQKYKVREDYDILYICSNAMLSEMYDKSNKHYIELLSFRESRRIVTFSGKGSWRTDKPWYDILRIV